MNLKLLLYLQLVLSVAPASYAGEQQHRRSLSLTPSFHGGIIGIKDASRSSLAYNGPLAGAGLYVSTRQKAVDLYLDAAYSFGWLGTLYHRDSKSAANHLADLSIGGMKCFADNNIAHIKAGCAFGCLGDAFVNQRIDRHLRALTIDAKVCASASLKLSGNVSVVIEDQLPFLAFIMTFNKSDIPLVDPDHSFKSFPGNHLRFGICRHLKDGRSLMLVIRHRCYSSGSTLLNSFQLQYLELGFAFNFNHAIL